MNILLLLLFLSIVLAKYKEESIFDWFDENFSKHEDTDSEGGAGAVFLFVMFIYLPLMLILAYRKSIYWNKRL